MDDQASSSPGALPTGLPAGLPVPVVRLDPDLPLPGYAHPGDAGADLHTTVDVVLAPGERALVPTGIALDGGLAIPAEVLKALGIGPVRLQVTQFLRVMNLVALRGTGGSGGKGAGITGVAREQLGAPVVF